MSWQSWAIVTLFVAALAARAAWRVGRRAARRAGRRWARRAGAAAVGFVVVRWWTTRRRRAPIVLAGDDMWAACPLSRWGKGYRDLLSCRWCNQPLPAGRVGSFCGPACADPANDNHVFARARSARRRMDGYRCTQCGSGDHLEVDHITPALGRHNQPGCIHHLVNLRTLCGGGGRSCHQQRTRSQHRAGVFRQGRRAS